MQRVPFQAHIREFRVVMREHRPFDRPGQRQMFFGNRQPAKLIRRSIGATALVPSAVSRTEELADLHGRDTSSSPVPAKG
jgi:hypothetical protein